jgi:hypothetical protein
MLRLRQIERKPGVQAYQLFQLLLAPASARHAQNGSRNPVDLPG